MRIVFALLLASIFNTVSAQVFTKCRAILSAVKTDSSTITANTTEAWLEINPQTSEVLFKVKLGSFKSNDATLNNELEEHNQKVTFNGNLGIDAYRFLNEMNADESLPITGYIKLNGKKHAVMANYSVFKQHIYTGDPIYRPLFTMQLVIKLSDYEIAEYFPEFKGSFIISVVRQPVNIFIP